LFYKVGFLLSGPDRNQSGRDGIRQIDIWPVAAKMAVQLAEKTCQPNGLHRPHLDICVCIPSQTPRPGPIHHDISDRSCRTLPQDPPVATMRAAAEASRLSGNETCNIPFG
jgi:hypothetical protein